MSVVSRLFLDGLLMLLALGLGAVILWPVGEVQGLLTDVSQAMPDSGVSHPVTAVLLNFRAYDTLLEMLVLLLALVGVRSLDDSPRSLPVEPPSPVLVHLLRFLAPLLLLITAYLLWRGSTGPGGAFQAGSVLGAAGILWLLAERPAFTSSHKFLMRVLPVLGIAAFTVLGMGLAVLEGAFLAYPANAAGALIFSLEVLASVSIAVTLVVLFAGGRSQDV